MSVVVLGLKSRPGAVAAGWQLYFRPRPGSSADERHTARLGWGVYDFVLYCRTHIISSHPPPSRNCLMTATMSARIVVVEQSGHVGISLNNRNNL